ncbi:MAG: zinc ribbon domain-containing protein [Armatimonas sp.]
MARCKACGTEAPAMARFCSICGAAVAAPTPPPASAASSAAPRVPPAPTSSVTGPPGSISRTPTPTPAPSYDSGGDGGKKALAIGSGLVLLGIAGFFIAKSSGLLGVAPTKAPTSNVLAAPDTKPAAAPVLSAPQVDAPKSQPVLAQPPPVNTAMPEDIIAYLRWLKALNQNLQSMHADIVATGTSILPSIYGDLANMASETEANAPAPNNSATTQKLQKIVQNLNQVTGTFQSRTPPNACAPLATEYNKALQTTVGQTASMAQMFTKLITSLTQDAQQGTASSQEMLPKLMQELSSGAMSKSADAGFNNSDAALNQLRDRYTQIPSDIAPGNFQLKSLDTGFDPKTMLRGLPGAAGGMTNLGM